MMLTPPSKKTDIEWLAFEKTSVPTNVDMDTVILDEPLVTESLSVTSLNYEKEVFVALPNVTPDFLFQVLWRGPPLSTMTY